MRDSIPGMIATLKETSLVLFCLGMAIYFAGMIIASFRLRILLSLQGVHMTTMDVLRVNLLGCFFSTFLPTSIGGDIVKAFYIAKESKRTMQSYTSVFIDRFLGMFTIFLIALAALIFIKDTSGLNLIWLLAILIICSLLLAVTLFNKKLAKHFSLPIGSIMPEKLKREMKNIYNAMHNYKNHKKNQRKSKGKRRRKRRES